MTQQQAPERRRSERERAEQDETFERHGPEPPENDSGPSPSVEEMDRYSDFSIRNVEPDEPAD